MNAIEKKVRKFVRSQFRAYIVRVDGHHQLEVKENSARVLINNPKGVFARLCKKLGKPVVTKHTATFNVKKVGTVSLTVHGSNSVLKLLNAK